MTRRLLNLLTALSLLLCVAAVVLYERSFFRACECNAVVPGVAAYVNASRGALAVGLSSTSREDFSLRGYERPPYHMSRANSGYQPVIHFGSCCVVARREWSYWIAAVQVPLWLPAAAFLALVSLAAAGRARRRWHLRRCCRRCVCASCGYDLRASPDRCPECGAVDSPDPVR